MNPEPFHSKNFDLLPYVKMSFDVHFKYLVDNKNEQYKKDNIPWLHRVIFKFQR